MATGEFFVDACTRAYAFSHQSSLYPLLVIVQGCCMHVRPFKDYSRPLITTCKDCRTKRVATSHNLLEANVSHASIDTYRTTVDLINAKYTTTFFV